KHYSEADEDNALNFVRKHEHCIIEEWVFFDKEISVVFTRSVSGEITFFPVPENEHKDHILYQSIAPAEITGNVKEQALKAAKMIAEEMNIVGTFAIEMFVAGENMYEIGRAHV